ncbi:PAS domain S-box-containing protein/diguanylate cyclase (GGDEF) domain-containing protein [Epsilonproteobacteria bacterium SCGC AD-308-O04]|jgi:diguanylate cyclase (GGDEF)-like protein/PAS domain S-box-containing protein|nr:PAS domain S-box-containing protein/diguanylate cyclase (GGDEF) domain-containing protein [Epsilonproteobacteria bacterium SCGC AD-311-C15]SMP89196.1 PAS domain S-box-containing protein/diguanylate cyclase (GGDEF) domain-containing protein [Epsilonproteobacteria bacterium SCGC AD-308-O04]
MSSQFNKFYKFLPFITIVIGISVSIFVGWFTYHYYEEKENSHLELASNEIVVLVEARMAAYEQVLRSGVGFFNASDSVSRNAWAIFVKDHKLNDNFKGIQGFGYSEVVFPQNKLVHEERIKKEGFADFKIHPDGQRELYTSIIYLEPFDERNIRAFGYDMFSEKVRREAMLKAMKSGEATLSGKITLVQEFDTNIQAGFLVYLPVYKKGSKLATPQDRVSATQGFVYAPFRANDLMDGVLGTMFPHIHFEIFDGNLPTKQSILFDSNTNNEFTLVYKTTNLTINGHTWTLLFKTNSILESEDIYIVFIIPSFILILTLLLYLLLNSLIKTKENAVQIAKKATQKLQDSEERLRYALEGAGDGLWDWNLKTNEVFFSKRWKEMLGFAEDEIDSTLDEWKNRIYPEDIEQVYADITAHIEDKSNTYINEHRVKCKDGSYKWILDRGLIVSRDVDGSPVRMVGSHSDISERKQSQLRLEEYMRIIDKNVISSTTNLNGKIIKASQAFCDISGYSKDELLGRNHNIVRHPDMLQALYKELWETIQAGNVWKGEIKNMHKNGSSYWVDITISSVKNEKGETISYAAIRHDITDKKRIEELSVTDRLTQLYNRLKLDEIFAMKLATAGRYNTPFSVVIIDIDLFKLVNDTWGHQAGDDVLKEFSAIIKNNARETDIVGRWGGEEFLILSSDTDLDGAIKLSEKLREMVSSFKFSFTGHKTASFGVSSYHAGDDEKTMIKRADDALYRAKENGRNRVEAEEYN